MVYLKVMQSGITAYLKHPFLLCQNNYSHYLSLSSYLANLQNPWISGKSINKSMGEDISQNVPWLIPCCNAEKQRCVMNEILLCLQEELEGMGSSLELFGLPTPNMEFHVERAPKTISEEFFSC